MTHPDDLEPIGRTFKGSLIGDEYGIRSRIVRKDGEIRHIHGRGVVTSDAVGRPLKVLAIVQDIIDYINEDISLKESQRSFRTSSRRARTWRGRLTSKDDSHIVALRARRYLASRRRT